MIALTARRGTVTPPPQIKSRTAPTETAEQALEAFIKTTFTGKQEISVNEFKNFLGTIQNWICSANDFDIKSKEAAIGNVSDNGGKIIDLMTRMAKSNPAVAAILKERETATWIDEGIKTIGTTLKDVTEGYENLKHLSITDKVLQMGLTDETSNEIANRLKDSPSLIKFTGTKYTEEEQKAVLYTILEKAVQKANAESTPEKKASVLSETLNQALGENAFKFSQNFIQESAAEIEKNISLINSINLGLNNTKLIKFITGDINTVKERLAEVPGSENSLGQKWTKISSKLNPDEIKQVKVDTDKFIARLQELVKADENYNLGTEEGKKNIKKEIDNFKKNNEAKSTYFDLVTNKAAEAHETKKDMNNILSGSGLGDLFGQGIAAIMIFTAFKALTSGNNHVAGLGMPPHGGGGGFMKKALGMVFMATVMNSAGLLTGTNDQETANAQ
jgi:hypothetical protein